MSQEDEHLNNFSLRNVKQHNRDVFAQDQSSILNTQFNVLDDSKMNIKQDNILQALSEEGSSARNESESFTSKKSQKTKKSGMRRLDKDTEEEIYSNFHSKQQEIIVNEQELDPEHIIQPFAGEAEEKDFDIELKTLKTTLQKEPTVSLELLKQFNEEEEIEDLYPCNEFYDRDIDSSQLGDIPEPSFLGGQSDINLSRSYGNSSGNQGSQQPLNKRSSGASSIVYSAQYQQSQEHMKKAITDSYFDGEDQEELTETIKKVYEYTQQLSKDKLDTLKIFEKKLKKFIFDYRYDSRMQPRNYYSNLTSEQNLRQKFRDEKYDQRNITYTIAGPDVNPFALLANELDVYVDILSNEPCIKMACYSELQEYFSALFQEEIEIQANFQTEKLIYHQCITITFKENKLTLKIRVQPKESNLFKSRDLIIKKFHEQNSIELNIFSSFVLYWVQKKKLMSTDCLDKNAWIILILHFFQINKRIPPAVNYDLINFQAQALENECYASMQKKYQEALEIKEKSFLSNSRASIAKPTAQDAGPQTRQRTNLFDFDLFKKKNSVGNYVLLSQIQRLRRRVNDGDEELSGKRFNQDILKVPLDRPYQILPISIPLYHAVYQESLSQINYGQFFYKFIHYLHHQLFSSPTAISLSGQLIWKKKNPNNAVIIEPIAIMDFVSTNVNLVSHLSYSIDAVKHLTDQIEIVYDTIQKKKSAKLYLSEIQKPYFANKRTLIKP